jgi:predicted dehydrogenase
MLHITPYNKAPTKVAIVGAGYVADYYISCLGSYPHIELVGIADRNQDSANRVSEFYGIRSYESVNAMLSDGEVEIVINLTNPQSHFAVSRSALLAGKHVYSEKPLALSTQESLELAAIAEARGLKLTGAPYTVLSHAAQTLWRELGKGSIGTPVLAYAEMDDGFVTREAYRKWRSKSGAPWPFEDEFAVGCVIEHASYPISWLAAMFGPVRRVTAFSSCLVEHKCGKVTRPGPDFAVAAIAFTSDFVCRLTCSSVATRNHRLTIIGEKGILSVVNCFDDFSPVYLSRRFTIRRRTINIPIRLLNHRWQGKPAFQGSQRCDFARGVWDLAAAIREGGHPRLSAQFLTHVSEVVCAINEAGNDGVSCDISSSFEPVLPMEATAKDRSTSRMLVGQ